MSQPRYVFTINDNWQFYKGDLADPMSENVQWSPATLPHTWNARDPFDEKPGYYRGIAWYRKRLDLDLYPAGERVYLRFEAANQEADVFVNGVKAGNHKGGYTAFCFDITPLLSPDENWITVRVDNSHDVFIPPLRGDFNFYGGIYRDVQLILTENVHFNLLDDASSGVYVSTADVSNEQATVLLRGSISNSSIAEQTTGINIRVRDAEGRPVGGGRRTSDPTAPLSNSNFAFSVDIRDPILWTPDNPYLYSVECSLTDPASGNVLDRISLPLGIRKFSFDPDSGFYLNGGHLKLVGVNRHQDFPGRGNALTNAEHLRDMQMIKDMGANVYRPAHYPQDPAILEACDRLGLLVMMEIPLDHDQTNDPKFYENSRVMMREMIRQYFNHPSIIIWAYMNEMFLGRQLGRDKADIDSIVTFARELEQLVRTEDSTRYTMIPNHGQLDIYHQSGLTDVPMIVGWNLYYGWYVEGVEGFGDFVDQAHAMIPGKPMLITEYGAGAHPRIRSLQPRRFDFSQEWETAFHHSHLRQIYERPFIAGSAVWNMFDFGSESRKDAMPYVNNKGLCSFDRRPKDVYYLYRAWLAKERYVKVAWSGSPKRLMSGDTNGKIQLPVQVFGNVDRAELFVNGLSCGIRTLTDHAAHWTVSAASGLHKIRVEEAGEISPAADEIVLDIDVISDTPPIDAQILSCNFGSTYFYEEEHSGVIWLPEKEWSNGAWGYRGGQAFVPRDRGIGTDQSILNTPDDPLYQTQRIAPEKLSFHMAPGKYQVRLLFAELQRKAPGERVFSVEINGNTILEALDIAKICGQFAAMEFTSEVEVTGDPIEVTFTAETGEPVINAVQIMRGGF